MWGRMKILKALCVIKWFVVISTMSVIWKIYADLRSYDYGVKVQSERYNQGKTDLEMNVWNKCLAKKKTFIKRWPWIHQLHLRAKDNDRFILNLTAIAAWRLHDTPHPRVETTLTNQGINRVVFGGRCWQLYTEDVMFLLPECVRLHKGTLKSRK